MIGFCVVDDHEVVHDGLRALAGREPDLEFLGAASTVGEGEGLVARTRPDVALVDLRIGERGGGSGIELCRALTRDAQAPAVVIFSAYGNRDLLAQAIDAGASGYMLKETSVSRVPEILREVVTAGSWFEPRIAGELLQRRRSSSPGAATFSERDLAIVQAIGRGESNHEIGERLHLSSHTVKYHVASMLRRHGCSRRAELVRIAHDLHLLDES
ncbi:DNA-binding NarL/FixJ family response regulator [Actinomycetospora succinea]|uniref:DNA-binding NarL/FixJ family response regulator n=1 Tax=Actinomycetospora succinea TaxID=663603 RepID=A0A4R6UY19_9PSEU|nr:response regulator transcription factor [Actinomycetospora succinea]TDQ50833.1 DNA-binding NarL/FixJ family response regulator [Actinomycetospora succinea]